MKITEYHKRMFENIYDLIKGAGLSKKQIDPYAIMSRKFEKQAKRDLRTFIRNKDIEWDGDNNTISLGKHFTIKLIPKTIKQ